MGDSSSEEENTPRNRKPKLFSENQSSSEEKRSLCQVDDQHLNLWVDNYLPDDYKQYPCECETYAVFSFPGTQAASSHRKEKSRPIAIGATALAPDDSQTDTPSSDGSNGEKAHPKSKVKNSITTVEDSSNGYSGCSESEASSDADQHRINEISGSEGTQYYHRTITLTVPHKDFCCYVSRWRQHRDPIDLPTITLPQSGMKISKCQLHCRGLDRDFYERNATITAVVQFLPDSLACRPSCECTFELCVRVFEGRDIKEASLLSRASQRVKVTDFEQETHVMHVTVHNIVKLDKIVYSYLCPKMIGLEITASLTVVRSDVRDSGCIDMSKSSERFSSS